MTAWEDRNKLKEATLTGFPRSRATPVIDLKCSDCKFNLSGQGMQVYYKNNPAVDLFSTNVFPKGTKEARKDLNHGMCGCRVRELGCQCGTIVGYRMYERCKQCSSENDEDEGHVWYFQDQCVEALPRIDPATGETVMWPGFDFPSIEESSNQESPSKTLFDENSIIQQDPDTEGWSCSPLADRNGRARVSFGKPANAIQGAQFEELLQHDAALRQHEDLSNREAALFADNMSRNAREKHLRDVTEEHERVDAENRSRENELEKRENALKQCKIALDSQQLEIQEQARSQQSVQGADEATKRALYHAEQKIANVEAEAEAFKSQIAEQKLIAARSEEKQALQVQEIQQLHNALAQVRREVRKSVGGDDDGGLAGGLAKALEAASQCIGPGALAGRGRLPPTDEAAATPSRVLNLEQELMSTRVELATVRVELQQAKQRLESKEAELELILPEITVGRMQAGSRRQSSAHKDVEGDYLRRELLEARTELASLRPEVDRLRAVALRTGTQQGESDEFVQARLAVAQKLSEKRMELDKREQALVAREASFPHGAGAGVQQAFGDIFERIGCTRRQQPMRYTGRIH